MPDKTKLFIVSIIFILLFVNDLQAQERFGNMSVKIDSALTKHFPNAIVYRDSLGRVSFRLKLMPDLDFDPAGRVLIFENGSPYANKGAVLFDGLTKEELEYILAQMEFYRTRKKVRHD